MGRTTTAPRSPAGALALALLATWGPVAPAADAARPLRYRLESGRELTYRTVAKSDRQGDGTVYKVDWKVTVLGQDADGAWRLVLRCDLGTERPSDGPKGGGEVDTLLWRCRLFDDGRLVGATTMGTVRDPFRLFPRLPDDAGAAAKGWEAPGSAKDHNRLHFRLVSGPGPDDPAAVIAMTSDGPIDKVYESAHKTRATFDTRRGLVTRVETEDSSGFGSSGTTKGTIELVSVEDRGAEWAGRFGRDADAYFAAVEAYEAAVARAGRDAGECRAKLDEAKAALAKAREPLAEAGFREAIGRMLERHDESVSYRVERAARRAKVLGKPAADWEAKDLDGKTHKLADYRGKVVVLDFWYRGCGWCMFAMPQVNRLSEAFRDDPVAVLGMTIDEKPEDARLVVEAMGLRYPAIRARELPGKYGVQGYPTLIVIDRQGKVREVHVGYSPRLFDELSELIRGLLAEPAEGGKAAGAG